MASEKAVGVDALADAERSVGLDAAIRTVDAILTDHVPLDKQIAELLKK